MTSLKSVGLGDLVVGGDREAELVGVDRAFGGVGGRSDQRVADLLERHAAGGKLGRIDLDADRRGSVAEDRDLGDAGHLRDLLGEE